MVLAGQGERVPDLSKLLTHNFKGLESVPNAFATAGRSVDNDQKLVVKVVVEC